MGRSLAFGNKICQFMKAKFLEASFAKILKTEKVQMKRKNLGLITLYPPKLGDE